MNHTTNPQDAEPFRIPIAHSVRYAVRGLPEVPNQYGPGTLAPSEITLTYRSAPDSQLGRVHAYVAGRLWADGTEIPLLPGGLYGQHYDDGLEGWPDWLAEEARLHDPAASPSAVVSADRATLFREAADVAREEAHRLETGNHDARAARGARSVAYLLRQMANEPSARRVAAEEQPAETQDGDREQPRIIPDPDREGVILHLPEITYIDTQVWAVDVGLTTAGLAALRAALTERPAVGEQPDTQTREGDRA